ncbi:MAG: hypothetical protein Q9209_007844 [Squamulea sp. 1 TL-2023]
MPDEQEQVESNQLEHARQPEAGDAASPCVAIWAEVLPLAVMNDEIAQDFSVKEATWTEASKAVNDEAVARYRAAALTNFERTRSRLEVTQRTGTTEEVAAAGCALGITGAILWMDVACRSLGSLPLPAANRNQTDVEKYVPVAEGSGYHHGEGTKELGDGEATETGKGDEGDPEPYSPQSPNYSPTPSPPLSPSNATREVQKATTIRLFGELKATLAKLGEAVPEDMEDVVGRLKSSERQATTSTREHQHKG